MAKFDFLNKELVDKAAHKINDIGIPTRRGGSKYKIRVNNKYYPYKLLVTEAAKLVDIELTSSDFSSSPNNRDLFEKLTGYKSEPIDNTVIEMIPLLKNIRQKFYDNLNKSILSGFRIPSMTGDGTYFKIYDGHKGGINDAYCHYEIRHTEEKVIRFEVHFEKKRERTWINEQFKLDSDLFEWFEWYGAFSIRSKEFFNENENEDEVYNRLLFLIEKFEDSHADELRRILKEVKEQKHYNTMEINSPTSLNQILYGPPGTGKTYHTVNKAIEIIDYDYYQENKDDRKALKAKFKELKDNGQIVFTSFHQSLGYEEFIEGIKPLETADNNITYAVEDGIFKSISKKASLNLKDYTQVIEKFKNEVSEPNGKLPITIKAKETTFDVKYKGTNVLYVSPHASARDKPWYPVNLEHIASVYEGGSFEKVYNPTYVREIIKFLKDERGLKELGEETTVNENYVLIIDEINRGNIAQIFGELITLIEDDKRLGASEELKLTLPYSKKEFGVPANLYIIGTMNTADRSVEALDTALRRRFTFNEMMPNYNVVKKVLGEDFKVNGVSIVQILETINKRLSILVDRDHQIGHAWFLSLKEKEDIEAEKELQTIFKNKIIPLLQEFFFNDYGKIGLVLGSSFVNNYSVHKDCFASFEGYDSDLLNEQVCYEITSPEKWDFSSIVKTKEEISE